MVYHIYPDSSGGLRANHQADFDMFMSMFNFLEPAITIIAQTIPIFRVLLIRIKRGTQNGIRINLPGSRVDYFFSKSNSLEAGTLDGKVRRRPEQDHDLFHVRDGPGGRIIQVTEPHDSTNEG